MSSDLVKRLRTKHRDNNFVYGGTSLEAEAADRIESLKDEVRVVTITMKGWINGYEKAVAKVEALEAEVERLRVALEEIASGRYSGLILTSIPPQDPAVVRARRALREAAMKWADEDNKQ
ncbi:MAG: hypothetical protein ACK52I_16635 [Pseudomonadota bacterium]|jgi:CO/xanthine dehydrogenase FAD-binding subunit